MARASDAIAHLARVLAHAERSPLAIDNYRSDLDALVASFEPTNNEPMNSAKVTPTNPRRF